jgi:hypothetical protein
MLAAQVSNSQTMDSCHLNYEASKIPSGVRKEIKRFYKNGFVLANPKEKFQSTDVVEGRNLKDRRLVFSAACMKEFILVYEHGGYAYHKHLILLNEENGKWKIVKNINAGKAKSIEEIREKLREQKAVSFDHF